MVTVSEYWQFVSFVADRLVRSAEADPSLWARVVGRLADFPPPDRAKALELLGKRAAAGTFPKEAKEKTWIDLDKLIRQHRKFASAEWALPTEDLEAMQSVADALAPLDTVDSNSWLFDEHIPDVGVLAADYSERQEDVDDARKKAVQSVFNQKTFDGLVELASRVGYPWFVGTASAAALAPETDESILQLLDSDDQKLQSFASGYARQRVMGEGWAWLEDWVPKFEGRPNAQARLLQSTDDLQKAWELVEALGAEVESAYWSEFSPLGRGQDFEFVDRVAEALMKFGRPLAALDLMAMYARRKDRSVSVELVAQGLESLMGLPEDHQEAAHLSQYELDTLLDYLRESGLSEERLGILEWQLLPALGFEARTPTLERRLARDPEFFVEVLSLLYRPKNSEETRDVPEHVASSAWRLLNEWRIVPGSEERLGEIDAARLGEWIERARVLLDTADRKAIGEIHIGHVFSHSREDEDETWPSRPVRDAIERLGSSEVENGLATQIYNNRGVTSRGLLEGGAQERDLADHYGSKAELIRDGWPRTAAVLMSVAAGYESDARRNDSESERWREGLE